MFPVSDFNVVVAGMATFAATVGYVCSKRVVRRNSEANSLASGSPTSPTFTTTIATATTNTISSAVPMQSLPQAQVEYTMLMESEQAPTVLPSAMQPETEMVLPSKISGVPNTSSSLETTDGFVTPEPLHIALQPIAILPSKASADGLGGKEGRRQSLKRKQMHDHDENNNDLDYPYNLTAIYPNKRRTPPREVPREPRDEAVHLEPEIPITSIQSVTCTDVQLNDICTSSTEEPVSAAPAPVEAEASSQGLTSVSNNQALSVLSSSAGITSSEQTSSPTRKPILPLPKSSPKSISDMKDNSSPAKPSATLSTSSSNVDSDVPSSTPSTNGNAALHSESESKPKSNPSISASPSTPNSTTKSNAFTAFSSYTSPSTSKGKTYASSPFSNFSSGSGSCSPFSAFSNSSFSPKSSMTTPTPGLRPIWSLSNGNASGSGSDDGVFRKRHAFSDSENHGGDDGAVDSSSPLVFGDRTTSPSSGQAIGSRNGTKEDGAGAGSFNHKTGEEEETVECELKGVKLFIKRGTKDYSSGMLGHVKLLSSKNHDVERLLFRREPLWKISMNARLHPTVRCSFDSEESILRVIMPELNGTSPEEGASNSGDSAEIKESSSSKSGATEIVVYAMKPGRFCSKQEFGDFASSVMKRSGLKC